MQLLARARPSPALRARRSQSHALSAVCAVLFLTFLDTTIVSVALGDVQSSLHAGVTSLQWVVSAYALLFASLMLTFGTLGDRFGRKRVMVCGVIVFAAGSLLGALATGVGMLIGSRAIMGIGAAASEPGTLSVLRHIFPERRERARAVGTWAAVTGLALAFGPVVGGALVGAAGWRGVFWFNVAFAVVLVPITIRLVPESSDPEAARLDLPGLLLGATAVGAAVFAIIAGETSGYTTEWIDTLFAIAAIAAVAFVLVELRSEAPMLNLRYFRLPAFSGALAVAFALYFGIFSIFFFTALYLEEVAGYSGYRAAGAFAPMAAALIGGSWLSGGWVARAAPAAHGLRLLGRFRRHPRDGAQPSRPPELRTPRGQPRRRGARLRSRRRPGHNLGHRSRPTRALGDGRLGDEHEPELGAVFGVAVLGALVNAHLTSDLSHRLHALGIPPNFQSIVINAVETGSIPSGGTVPGNASGYGPIVKHVISAAYGAFHAGLTSALLVSAFLILAAAIISALTAERADTARALDSPVSTPSTLGSGR